MPAAKYDIVIEQGATFIKELTWKNGAGTPVDLTGRTARMQLRRTVDSAEVVHTMTTENGGITLGGAAGTVTMSIPATTTATFTHDGVYDLEIVNGSSVDRLVQGGYSVSKEVTRV